MKKFYLLILCCLALGGGFAQTLIDPILGGGFDLGNTFALNGWTVVNSSANKWVVGTTTFNSSPNSAYISSDGNVANYDYDNTTAHISHFYQQVTIPANATNVILSFELKGNIENDIDFNLLDGLEVYTDASLTAPVADGLPGGTAVLQLPQYTADATYVGQTINLNSLAGKTVLVIFTWINDADGIGSDPPASVDDVKLTYCIKNTNYTVSGGGGFCPGGPGAHIGLPGSVVGINYQLYNNGIAAGSPVAGTGAAIDFGPQPVGGPYTVIGSSGACTYNMLGSVSVSLFPPPTASAGSNTPVCTGSTLNLASSAGSSYSWTGPNSFTASTQNASIPNVTSAASGTYTVNVTDANGCTAAATTDVTITPLNTITLSSAAGTNAQSICVNSPITAITYATTGATGATFIGLPPGVTGGWASNTVTILGSPTTATGSPFNYTVTLTGGCGNITANGSISVVTANSITLTSAAGTDAQTVCINSPVTNITYATTGATGATFSGLPTGVTGTWSSNVAMISGSPSTSIGSPFIYTITLTGGCGATFVTGSISVITANTITLSSAAGTNAQTVCINSPLTDITYATTGATGATFTGLPAGVTGNWAANVVAITGTPTTTAGSPFNYTVTLTGGCGSTVASGSITVNSNNTISLSSAVGTDAQTLCINTPLTNIKYTTTGATGASFSGLPPGVSGSWAANVVTITGTPTSAVGSPFSYTVTLTGGCGNATAGGTITVNPNNTITLSSAVGSNAQVVCINAPVTNITYATTGATGATFSGLPAGVSGSWAANVVTITGTPTTVTGSPFNYTVTLTGGCGNITASGSVTVNPQNTIALSSAVGTDAQTTCFNTAITAITYNTATATGATFSGLPIGVTGSWASNKVTIVGTPLASGTFNYMVILTGGCGNTTASGTITVNPQNTITLSSAAGTDAQTVCINSAITDITYSTTTATGATFSGLPSGVSGSWVANTVTISGTPTVSGTFSYIITLTGGCGIAAASGIITVKPVATVSLTSAAGTDAQAACIGSPVVTITYALNNAGGASVTGLPAGLTVTPGAGTLTISGSPTVNGNFTYTITTTGGCGTATATGTITIQPAIGGTATSMAICSGGSGSLTLSGQSGNIIRWEYSTDGGTTWVPSAVIPNTTATQSFTNVIIPTLYRAVVSNGCGNVNSATGLVSIHNLWTGTVSSDWNTAGNWSDGQVPSTSCPEVYIPGATPFEPVLSGAPTAAITNLNILSGVGARLTVNGTGLIQIGGTISNLGILDVTDGTLELNGASGTQNISGDIFYKSTIKNLTVSNNVNVANTANDTLNILGTLSFGNATAGLNTGDNVTLKSTAVATANVGILAAGNTITGNVIVERYIATGTTGAPNHGKSWQLLAIPTSGPNYNDGQTIKASWQEGATVTNISTAGAVGPGNPIAGHGTMITSAVTNAATQPSPGFDAFTSPGPSMKYYDSVSANYFGTSSTQVPIYNQEGYFVFVRGDRSVYTSGGAAVPTVLRTKGTLFTPAHLAPVSAVAAGDFASVGNPYASAIDMRNITLSGGTQQFFTVWDPRLGGAFNYGAFQTFSYNSGTGNYEVTPGGGSYGSGGSVNNYIQSGQAFFVQAFGSNGTVSFKESCKAGGSALFTTPNPVNQVQHTLRTSLNTVNVDGSTGSMVDGVLSQFDDSFSNNIDGMDARKSTNTGENLAIRAGGKLLVIERRQTIIRQDTIFLSITGERAQSYRFHFDAENLDPSVQGVLVDSYNNSRTPLNMNGGTDVNFTVANVTGSNAVNRFMIVFEPLKALPVTFTSIKAYQQDKNINVEWRVDNEMNIKEYQVEKSTDGNNFTTIATKPATANNGGCAVYVTADTKPVEGYNYYRVKSMDVNGKTSYTNVVKVLTGSMKQDITIYPNPITDGMIHLQLVNMPEGKYNIRLLNKLGQLIVQKQVGHAGGNATEIIKWDYNLAHGMYQLEVTKPDGSIKNINVLY